jgi:choline dehydrogenase
VIVGGGTAGCALAAKLSDPDAKGKFRTSVLVLEAGVNLTNDSDVLVNNLIGALEESNNPKLSTVALTYTLGQSVDPFGIYDYIEGRMWGGSSGHNFLLATRGTPSVYDEWAAISGDARWSYNNLLNNVMIPMEHYTPDGTPVNSPTGPVQRGVQGPIFITQLPPLNGDAFMQAVSVATDAPLTDDYNNPNYGDVAIAAAQNFITPPFLSPSSYRSFSGNAYLTGEEGFGVPAIVDENGNGLDGRKLKIISNAHANRVLFSSKRKAKGVEYVIGNAREKVLTVKAKKEIILCTGTFDDPAILQRSGIGSRALLNDLGIPVVFANDNVGSNMQNHFGTWGLIGGDASTTIDLPNYGLGYIGFAPNTSERTFELLIFNHLVGFPQSIIQALGITDGIAIAGLNLVPKSTGTVAILSRDPFMAPTINFNAYSDVGGDDANTVVEFYNLLQDIATESNGTVLYPTAAQYAGGPAALFEAGFVTLDPQNHACGTCRMAQSAADGVVDGHLRVFGVKGLRVASNSVVPVINNGHTSYTADVVGLELACTIRAGG